MRTKPKYSALSKLNGTYAYAPYGMQVMKDGDPVGYAVIGGSLYYLWQVNPETEHLPKIKVDGYAHRKPTVHLEDLSPVSLLNRTAVLPITPETVVVQAFDPNRWEYLTTVFPTSEAEKDAIIRWAKERHRGVVVGSGNYTL